MAYPCGLPEFHSWNSQGKLDDLHFQSHLQTSTGQSDSDVLPVRMTEDAIKTGDSFATLFSPFHTGAAWKQILGAHMGNHDCTNLTQCGATRRNVLLELTPALHSSAPWLPTLQKALGAAHGWSGRQRQLCKARHFTYLTQPDP